MLRRMHELLVATQNPVYAWLGIKYLFFGPDMQSPDWPIDKALSVPGWIAAYLQRASESLTDLAAGVDFRVETTPLDPTKFSTFEDMKNSDEWRKNAQARTIDPVIAMGAVPAALELTRDRWNAFKDFSATTNKMQEFRAFEAMKADGVPAKVAVGAVGKGIGVNDPSQVQARIRKGRSIATGPEVGKLPPADSPPNFCSISKT